jgi:TonB family protein
VSLTLDIEGRAPQGDAARTLGATSMSTTLHVAIIVSLLIIARQGESPEPLTDGRVPLAFITQSDQPGLPTGGGTFGDRLRKQAPRAEQTGRDRQTVPARHPPGSNDSPEITAQEIAIPALPTAADLRQTPGSMFEISVAITTGGPAAGRGSGDGTFRDGLNRGRGGSTGDGSRGDGGRLVSPEVIKQVRPNYTTAALQARIRGLVVLEAVVLPDGSVGDVKIVRSLDRALGLDAEAIKAVKQWRFRPGKRSGDPIPMLVTVEMMFELR